jgi:hypothetical protein
LAFNRKNKITNGQENEARLIENTIIKYPHEDIWGAVDFLNYFYSNYKCSSKSELRDLHDNLKPIKEYLLDLLDGDDFEELMHKFYRKYGIEGGLK